jgi:HD superfamily phosphodiesterase
MHPDAMKDKAYLAALAGLLHDIGKLAQRISCSGEED